MGVSDNGASYDEMIEQSLFDVDNLTYCGEGNSTIVISNEIWGWIMRIRKACAKSEKSFESSTFSCADVVASSMNISRFFGARFTRRMHLIQTTQEFLRSVETLIESYRPAYRKSKGVDLSQLYIIVAPDAAKPPAHLSRYTYGPTLTVEIKPKFGGFIQWPSTGLVNLAKTSASLFCLRQNHCGKLSRWQQPSLYCPCDLFSGNRDRMVRSIHALLQTPQINLRIHLDGRLVFSHELDSLQESLSQFFCESYLGTRNGFRLHNEAQLCNKKCPFTDDCDRLIRGLLLDSLLYELDPTSIPTINPAEQASVCFDCQFHPLQSPKDSEDPESRFEPSTLPPHGSILGRVLATQLLSRVDICFVVPHYERVCRYLKTSRVSWQEYTQMSFIRRAVFLGGDSSLIESFDVVERYLIALVARDCSIMISLQRAVSDCPDWVPTVGGTCSCVPSMVLNAVVVDLDPKCTSKIAGRSAIEQAIVMQALERHPDFLQ